MYNFAGWDSLIAKMNIDSTSSRTGKRHCAQVMTIIPLLSFTELFDLYLEIALCYKERTHKALLLFVLWSSIYVSTTILSFNCKQMKL